MSIPGPAAPPALVERTLEILRRLEPDAGGVVLVSERSDAVLRWANSTMTTNGVGVGRSISVVALVGVPGTGAGGAGTGAGVVGAPATLPEGREGDAALTDLVRAAVDAARRGGPARDAVTLPAPAGPSSPGSFTDPAAETSISVFGPFAADLAGSFAAAAAGASAGAERSFGFAEHAVTTSWLGTTTGVRRRWVTPVGSVELNLKDRSTGASVWGGRGTRDWTDLAGGALASLVDELRGRLAWGRRRIELPAGRYETILPPSAVSDLLIYLAWSMGGRPAQEGRSALSRAGGTRVGERLTDLPLTLAGDPAAPDFPQLAHEPVLATTSSGDEVSVFDNGATTRRVEWITEGRVGELAYPRAAAAEFADTGARFAPPSDNLLLTGGTGATTADMVASTTRGLLLTCLWYIREVEPTTLLLTGLTRDGVYLVEDGEVVGEVNNFRWNSSPLDVLRRTVEAGVTDVTLPREWKDWFTRAAMPPLRVEGFTMSSVSQAS